jgi:Flp pilus assembly protein TadB
MVNKQTDKEWNEYKQNVSQALQQEIEQKLTGTNTTNIMKETNRMDMKLMNNIQTKNITWTETKLWTVSSIFFITLLLLGWFYPMVVLSICVIALCAMLLYVVIWLGTLLLKEILGLDDK